MHFADDLEATALRSGEEYAWRRTEALRAVRALADAGFAILGGELWIVRGTEVWAGIPQNSGPPGIYHWESERQPSESWLDFVERSCLESLSAIRELPSPGEVDMPAGGEIYYNLTWVSRYE